MLPSHEAEGEAAASGDRRLAATHAPGVRRRRVNQTPSADRESSRLYVVLAACGGFLLSTLWFDLMFDVQVVGQPLAPAALPESVLASIAAYYRRVTTDAAPMSRLIAAVMVVAVLGSVWGLRRRSHRGLRWLGLLSSAGPIVLAAARVVPNAVRLGTGAGSPAERSALARAIFTDHVLCAASIVVFTIVQIVLAGRPWSVHLGGQRAEEP